VLKRALFVVLICSQLSAWGQGALDEKLDGSEQGKSLIEFLHTFEKGRNVRFFFLKEWLAQTQIQSNYQGRTLRDALTDILNGTDIAFVELYDYAVIFSKDPSGELERESLILDAKSSQVKLYWAMRRTIKPGKRLKSPEL
jgi:hypothetical protein